MYVFAKELQKLPRNCWRSPAPLATVPAMNKRKKAGTAGRPRNDSGLGGNGWQGRALRVRRLKSQRYSTAVELAAAVGVAPAAISRWEWDRSEPNPKQLAKLAKVLKCKPSAFALKPRAKADRALLHGTYRKRA